MEVISIKVLFTHSLNATINEDSISADFDSFKWKYINEFCDTLINYLTENDCEIHENLIKNISFNDNKTTIVGGLSFSVKSSHSIFNHLIDDFLNTIVDDGAKKKIFRKADISKSIYEFLLKFGSKPIKNSLKIISQGISYQIFGSFAKLEIPLGEEDKKEDIDVIGRIDECAFTSRRLQIALEDGSKIPNVFYSNYEFHEVLCDIFKKQSFEKFTLTNVENANGKKICSLKKVCSSDV